MKNLAVWNCAYEWVKRVAVAGFCALLLTAGVAFADNDYLNRYESAGLQPALERLASGYTHFQIDQYVTLLPADTIAITIADSTASPWWASGAIRSGTAVIRYDNLHVSKWEVSVPKFTADLDGPCSLFVWTRGDIGTAGTATEFPGSTDTLVYPFNGDIGTVVGIPPPFVKEWCVDSVLVVIADTMAMINFIATGDSL